MVQQKILSISSNNILQQLKLSKDKFISGENSPLSPIFSDKSVDSPDKNQEKKNDTLTK